MLAVGAGGTLGDAGGGVGTRRLRRCPAGSIPRAALGIPVRCHRRGPGGRRARARGPGQQAADGRRAGRSGCRRRSWERRWRRTIPLIYGAGPLAVVAYRWKTQLNENAKMHAFSHAFPEVGHNEIEGWAGARGGNFAAVFLRDQHQLAANTGRCSTRPGELIAGDAAVTARGRGPRRHPGRAGVLPRCPGRLGQLLRRIGARRRPGPDRPDHRAQGAHGLEASPRRRAAHTAAL